jgi:Glycosyl hydrolases family 35/Beta-galactosidase jelly roll domain/Beta-galactosidase, domain 2/Beta-galactosidase, domain 3
VNPAPLLYRSFRRRFSARLLSSIGRFGLSLGLVLTLAAVTVFAQDLPGQTSAHGAVVAAAAPVQAAPRVAGPAPSKTFLISAFNATSQDRLSLFSSRDGSTYTSLHSEVWQPPQGLLRDPSIIRTVDGCWAIVYTNDWTSSSFGVARSCRLNDWHHVADVPVVVPGAAPVTNVWAPEWFRDDDDSLSVVVSLSTTGSGGPFAAWRLQPTRPDFTAFGEPQRLRGLETRNPIDTFIVREAGRYLAFTKNESTKFIERATASSLDGPWTYDRTGDWAGFGGPLEGQALVRIVDNKGQPGWRLHADSYTDKRYYFSDSFDGLNTWTPRREIVGASGSTRHFTVLAEDSLHLAQATAPTGVPRKITWDQYSLMIDGQRKMIWAAEFQLFRLPSPSLWRDVLQKYKALGLNGISLYLNWGYHSPHPGHYDFTGVRNLERVLQMAKEEGLYVMVRNGPYVNAELSMGGYPGWVTRQRAEARTDAAEYQNATAEWLTQVNAIIARYQLTNGGGTVVAYQLENELFSVQPKNARHMQFLADKARADGITVPLFHNAATRLPDWTPRNSTAPFANPGPTDLYAFDGYPGGVCDVHGQPGTPAAAPDWGIYGRNIPRVGSLASPHTPGFGAEIGAGWFDYWGSNGTYPCTAVRQGVGYQRVFYGSNLINRIVIHSIYMGFGGTTWGWQAAPVVFTSYDYGAPIDEARGLRDKAYGLKAIGRFIQAAQPVLAQMDIGEPVTPSNPRVKLYHNVNTALKSHVFFAVHNPSSNTGVEPFSFDIDTVDGRYRVPQAGTLHLKGQDAKFMLAGVDLQRQRLVYSTSELWAQLRQGSHDLLLLHGRSSQDGETVLRYRSAPRVRVLAGQVQQHWDAARGDLRLNYSHQGLIELEIEGGGRAPLRLLLADEPTIAQFWQLQAGPDTVLVHSPALPRSAQREGATLVLQGDTEADSALRVWAGPEAKALRWNGRDLPTAAAAGDSLVARVLLPGPLRAGRDYTLPDLATLPWLRRTDSAETAPGFDDSRWRVADAPSSAAQVWTASERGAPVLAMSDYGFHRGDVWYRGRFNTTAETIPAATPLDLQLFYGAGGAGLIQVWLNGQFLGQHELDTGRPFPETTDTYRLQLPALPPGEHVLAVKVRNNGHNWNLFADDAHKEARGLIAASLAPRAGRRHSLPISWRLRGAPEAIADLARGPYNNGGLAGEAQGWHLPAAADAAAERTLRAGWERASPQDAPPAPGPYWLRTQFTLALPEDHDVQLGLAFGDTSLPRSPQAQYRVLIFVNGWNMGQFIAHVGPQRVFVLPPGVLNPRGDNTLALVVSSNGEAANAMEAVRLVHLRSARGGVPLQVLPPSRHLQR